MVLGATPNWPARVLTMSAEVVAFKVDNPALDTRSVTAAPHAFTPPHTPHSSTTPGPPAASTQQMPLGGSDDVQHSPSASTATPVPPHTPHASTCVSDSQHAPAASTVVKPAPQQ